MTAAVDLPVGRRDITFSPAADDGRFVVKDLRSGSFFRIGPRERALLELLDGRHDRQAVCRIFAERFSEVFSHEDLDDFISLAQARGLLEDDTPATAEPPSPTPELTARPTETRARPTETRARPMAKGRPRGQSVLFWRIRLCDPDAFFGWLAPKVRFFWTSGFLVFASASIALAVLLACANRAALAESLTRHLGWPSLVMGALTLLVVTALHESAHGLTCKHHGGEVHEMGFLLILFMPAFFCNVSDAWLFAEKRKRLAVTLAGGYFELFLWSLAVFTWRATVQDSVVNYLAWLVVSVSGVRVLFNMIPFIKLDGYYILSDVLDIPNLRQRALEGVAAHLRWLLWGAPRPHQARSRALLIYGVSCWIASIGMLGLVLTGMAMTLDRHVGHVLAGLATAPLAIVAGRSMFNGLAGQELTAMLRERQRRALAWLVLLGTTAGVLIFTKIEKRVTGTFLLRPSTRVEVRAPTAAFLKEVAGDEGDTISAGQRVALLEVPDLDSRLAQKQAEVRETSAKLRLLKIGASEQELDDARQRVQRARKWRTLAEIDLERLRGAFDKTLLQLDQKIIKVETQLKHTAEVVEKMKPLYQKRVVTGLQYHEAKTMHKCAQAELAQIEGEKAAIVSKGTLEAEDEVARRDKEWAEAEAALVLLEAGTRPEQIEAAEASLGRQREELAFLVELKKKLPLHSRVAGVITTPHFKDRVGEFFSDGALVCEIEEPSSLQVEITLDEDQVHNVELGQRVELKARALPYETFEASVERIAPAAVGGELQSTLVVYCQLANRSGRLRPAMSGHARIYGRRTPIGEIALDYVMRFIRTEFWW